MCITGNVKQKVICCETCTCTVEKSFLISGTVCVSDCEREESNNIQLCSNVKSHANCLKHHLGGDGGGFFIVCKDFWRMSDNSFPTCAFFFFFKWRLTCAH